MTVVIEKRGEYPNRSFASVARKAWNEFFKTATAEIDLAYWVIEAYSATIFLTGRSSNIDDCNPEYEPPTPIRMPVGGIIEMLEKTPINSHEEIREDFQKWAEKGILESFLSIGISKKYTRFDSKGASFAIVTSPTNSGITDDDFSVIWSNVPSFSKTKIKAQQKAARSKTKKKTVKKRRITKK